MQFTMDYIYIRAKCLARSSNGHARSHVYITGHACNLFLLAIHCFSFYSHE